MGKRDKKGRRLTALKPLTPVKTVVVKMQVIKAEMFFAVQFKEQS